MPNRIGMSFVKSLVSFRAKFDGPTAADYGAICLSQCSFDIIYYVRSTVPSRTVHESRRIHHIRTLYVRNVVITPRRNGVRLYDGPVRFRTIIIEFV